MNKHTLFEWLIVYYGIYSNLKSSNEKNMLLDID